MEIKRKTEKVKDTVCVEVKENKRQKEKEIEKKNQQKKKN